MSVEQILEQLQILPNENLGFAQIDHHRHLWSGFSYIFYCPGKTVEQAAAIFGRLAAMGCTVLATRAEPDVFDTVKTEHSQVEYYREARVIVLRSRDGKGSGQCGRWIDTLPGPRSRCLSFAKSFGDSTTKVFT